MNIIKSFIFSVFAAALIAGGVFIINKNQFDKQIEVTINETQKLVEEKNNELKIQKEQAEKEKKEQEEKIQKELEQKHKQELARLEKEKEEQLAKANKEKQQAQEEKKKQEQQNQALTQDKQIKDAKLLILSSKYLDAIDALEEVDQESNAYSEAQANIVAIHAYLGNEAQAIDAAKGLKSYNDQFSTQANIIAATYERFENTEDTVEEYKDALLAAALLEVNQLHLAKEKARQVTAVAPEYKDAHIIIGLTEFAQKNYNQAVKTLSTQTPLNNARADYYLALAHFNTKNYTKAAEHFKIAQAAGYNDDTQSLLETLAESLNYSGKYSEAATVYEQVITEFDKEITYYIKPTVIYIEQVTDPKKAVALTQKGIDRHPKEALAYNLAGWAKIAAGDFDEAQKLLDKAISIDDTMAAPYLNYGHIYVKKREFEVAKGYYEQAIERSPESSIGIRAREEINKILKGEYK